MGKTQPKRAPHNRTLYITAEEREVLKEDILRAPLPSPIPLNNTLIHGNTFEILKELPNEFAQLIILDPPYNLRRQFGNTIFKNRSIEEYEEYIESWLPSVCDKLAPNGSLYLCGDWKISAPLQSCLSRHLTILNRITWQRDKGRGALNNWKNCIEDIWFAVKNPKDYYFNVDAVKQKRKVLAPYKENSKPKDWEEKDGKKFRLTYPSNFWDDISIPFWSMPENTDHPTQKPEKLIAKLILASSRENDIVFDPFLGSGTTAVTASKLNRRFVGIEQEEEYCLLANKRLRSAQTDHHIQGYYNGVFWERNSAPQQTGEHE